MAPKKTVAKAVPKKHGVTKQAVKTKVPPSLTRPIPTPLRKTSNVGPSTDLLQDFVKVDQSVCLARVLSLRDTDAMPAQGLQEQAEKIHRELADHRKLMAAVSSRFEEANADFEAIKSRFEAAKVDFEGTKLRFKDAKQQLGTLVAKRTADLDLIKTRRELIEQREFTHSAAFKRAQLQTASNFEYQTKAKSPSKAGSAQHNLHVSFRHLDKSPGSKDWKALLDVADAEKLRRLQIHEFPHDAEAEIGSSTGLSHVEPLLTTRSILEKIEHLQEEAFAYIESSISFEQDSSSDILLARRHKFRAYIEWEKDSCYGPFKRLRCWLQERQKLEGNVAALFVRRNETLHERPTCDTFSYNGFGALYLRDDGPQGEMVSLQVKRDYRSCCST